jgi:hypothetical protein
MHGSNLLGLPSSHISVLSSCKGTFAVDCLVSSYHFTNQKLISFYHKIIFFALGAGKERISKAESK